MSVQTEHEVILKGRNTLSITGVKQIESFDNEEFLLETTMGFLAVRGENLRMQNLDVDKGILVIKGKIADLIYLDDEHSQKTQGFFQKLFR